MGSKRHGHEEGHENHERWLVTYSDLITLLLAFFIILYSMSNLDAEKYKKLAESLGSAFGGQKGGEQLGFTGGAGGKNGNAAKQSEGKQEHTPKVEASGGPDIGDKITPEFKDLAERIQKVAITGGLEGRIIIREEGRGLVLQLVDSLLFDTGQADLSPSASQALMLVGKELSNIDNPVRVEGHTDNVPINTSEFHSNWHLSTARAMAVVDLWDANKTIPSTRLSGAGYGEHRPIDDNKTSEGRAKNRRVDIVVIRDSVAQQEPEVKDGKVVTKEESTEKSSSKKESAKTSTKKTESKEHTSGH